MLKKTLFQLHWFCGITAGLILSIIGITGAIYSYDQQILTWFNPHSYVVKVENSPKLTPDQLYQRLIQQDPKRQINSITMMQATDASSVVNIKKEGKPKGENLMVNPYTAAILPEVRGKDFFDFILRLHRTLTLDRPVGNQITGICALMLIYFVLSGIYLRWPKKHSFKQWFFVKPKLKGRNFIWDLHAVVGTWVIVFYLLLAMTGLYWSYDWWRDGMFKLMGVDKPQPMQMSGDKKPKNEAKLSNEQINNALQQTWIGFNKDYKDGFSSLTFTIPKKENGTVDLSFFDTTPQHERARNSATYNYETHTLNNIKRYEDKALNEKIMSSMLPVHRGSFFGPVWQFLAMLSSLAMPLFFITGILLYLKRRKQKKLTQQAKQATIPTGTSNTDASTWLIIYASQTGTAEQIAWGTSSSLQEQQLSVTVKSIHKVSQDDLLQHQRILFILSTYGTGEAPDLATGFIKKIIPAPLDLSNLQYAVLALGSKEYADTYCQFGHEINTWLEHKNATPLFPLIEVDNADNKDVDAWYKALAEKTHLDLHHSETIDAFETCRLISRQHINAGSLGSPIYILEIATPDTLHWQAGDIAEIQPMNSAARIQSFMSKHQIDLDDTESFQILKDKHLDNDLILESADVDILKQLPILPYREYSIASIPQQNKLELVVRLKTLGTDNFGLGSGWLCLYADLHSNIDLRIRRNDNFHLVENEQPIILIGNGTGIAGLMSLLQERKSKGHQQNWLLFGERQREKDFIYQPELESLLEHSFLTHLDLAFSRDINDKCYVQHKLEQHSQRVKDWVAIGAVIYVCGSIDTMAHDVEQTLINILGEDKLDELRETDRYRRDVY